MRVGAFHGGGDFRFRRVIARRDDGVANLGKALLQYTVERGGRRLFARRAWVDARRPGLGAYIVRQ